MATTSPASTLVSSTCNFNSFNRIRVNFFGSEFNSSRLFSRKCSGRRTRVPPRQFRVYCESQNSEVLVRRSSPLLEQQLDSDDLSLASDQWKAVPDIWRTSAQKYGDRVAVVDPYHDPPSKLTYNELHQEILNFSEGLRMVGIRPDEKIALFADNSCRWLIADQGIMASGAINVVRGSRSSSEELLQIYTHSESVALVIDSPEFFNRVADGLYSKAPVRFVILLWGEKSSLRAEGMQLPIYTYEDITNVGRDKHKDLLSSVNPGQKCANDSIKPDDIASIMYTSGTTGNPKGVMLTHKNLLHQIKNFYEIVPAETGDKFLSMLPSWHAYERASEYFIFTLGVEQMYTSVRKLKDDLKQYQPHYIISVPLVYETLYSGIQKQISLLSPARKLLALALIRVSLAYMEMKRIYEGLCLTKDHKQLPNLISGMDWLWARVFAALLWPLHMLAQRLVYKKILSSIGISKAGISGGGSLPLHVDKFFEAIGLTLQNGYGLTETSPVISARRRNCNVLGSAGHPIRHTEFKIVDIETGKVLPPGSKGVVKVRGPQVMKGYYKNPLATKKVLEEDGWLDTGDMGWIAPHHSTGRSRRCGGLVVLEGRTKDTIVLSTGENVEPLELEEAAMRSSLIQQIFVIGQDQRRLGAIVVPNVDEALVAAKKSDPDAIKISKEKTRSLVYEELRKWTSECSFQIGPVLIVDEPFTIDNGLMTPTMKIRRDKVVAKYKEEIANLYK